MNYLFALASDNPFSFDDENLFSLELANTIFNKINESWIEIWDKTIFDTSSSWWLAILAVSAQIALFGVIFTAVKGFSITDPNERQQWIVRTITYALLMSIFFGDNGWLIAQTLKITKGMEVNLVTTLGETQIVDLQIGQVLDNVALTNSYRQEILDILSDCKDKGGDALAKCMEDNEPQIEAIVDEARSKLGTGHWLAEKGGDLVDFAKSVKDEGIGSLAVDLGKGALAFVANPFIDIVQIFLGALQAALAMSLQIASILHATLLPMCIGILFTPWGEEWLKRWIQGWVILALVQICYLASLGLAATSVTLAGAEVLSAMSFMLIVSLTGPTLAFMMARGGGIELAQSVSNSTTKAVNKGFSLAADVAGAAVTGGANLAGKSAGKVTARALARKAMRK